MSESLLYDDIEMLQGHPGCYLDKQGDILNTEDNSDFGFFVEVDIKLSDVIKQKF